MADAGQNNGVGGAGDSNGSLAMLRAALGSKPLDVSPAPASAGINPLAGLLGQAVKSYQSYQLRNKAIELLDREALAQKFDQIANDPRYDRDLQIQAEQHGNALRLLHPDDKLDKQYQPDKKDRTVPALNRILYQWHQRETAKRGGEPPPPPEPDEPAEPPPPAGMGMMPTADSSGSGGAGAGADASGAGAAMPAMPAQPGGVQLGPNQITPAPAIPGGAGGISGAASGPPPPPPPPAPDYTPPGPGLPPGMSQLPAGIGPAPGPNYDLGPSRRNDIEQAQRGAQIAGASEQRHMTKAEAVALGYPADLVPEDGMLVNKNFVPIMGKTQTALINAAPKAMALGGELVRGADGRYHVQGVPDDKLPAPLQWKKSHLENLDARTAAQTDYYRTMSALKTETEPARVKALQTMASAAYQRMEIEGKKVQESIREGMIKFPTDTFGQGYTLLKPDAQNKLQEYGARMASTDDLLKVYQPIANDNQPLKQAWGRLKYSFGRADEDSPNKYIGYLELYRVSVAGALAKSGSGGRAAQQVWQAAGLHTPFTTKDSPEMIYNKLQTIRRVLSVSMNDTVKYGNKYGLTSMTDLQRDVYGDQNKGGGGDFGANTGLDLSAIPPPPDESSSTSSAPTTQAPAPAVQSRSRTGVTPTPPPINQREPGTTTWNSPKGLLVWTDKKLWAPKAASK